MSDQFWLSEKQLARIKPCFPLSHGMPRVDDRKVISGIIQVSEMDCAGGTLPKGHGPHKTLYNRFIRWSKMGVFDKVFTALVAENGPPGRLMIDATHLKTHRTACSLLIGGMIRALLAAPKVD